MILYHAESDSFISIQNRAYDQLMNSPDGALCDEVDPSRLPAGYSLNVGLKRSTVLPSIDFETYSEASYIIDHATGKVISAAKGKQGGLPLVGTPNYCCHPSAEILSCYYDLKDGRGRRFWMPGLPLPLDLMDHIRRGGLIEAWNSTFEYWAWNMIAVRKYGWVELPLAQTRCVMSRARRYSLPGSLGKAAAVLGTPGKDQSGRALIRKLTRPQSMTKTRRTTRHTYANAWDDFVQFFKYNEQDVAAEDEAAALIPDLSPDELAQWLHDQKINARGVQVDTEALDACLFILGEAEKLYTMELVDITRGAVSTVNETAKMREYMNAAGLTMDDLTADTVKAALKADNIPPVCRRMLELRQALSSANVKKLRTLKLQISGDGRLRDQYMYCGADRTGRASAGGVQLQNITAKGPKSKRCTNCGRNVGADFRLEGQMLGADACPSCGGTDWIKNNDWTVEAVEHCIDDILKRDLQYLIEVWGDPITALCGVLRGLFTAKRGHELICCDFSAIEAVVAACLAREQWRINVFNTHAKIYEASAAKATGLKFEDILQYKKDNGFHHPARKGVGKIRELAGGYGGWIGAWKNFGAEEYFDNDDEIKRDVLKWREESPAIVEMWGGQYRRVGNTWEFYPEYYGLEGMAILAILNPGKCYSHIDITYGVYNDVLYCRLPSGRFLHYHRPRLVEGLDKLAKQPNYQITFEGYNSNAVKGPIGWFRLETYGGRLFENVVQAVSADIQFLAIRRAEERGYPIVMHTHDEGTAEVPTGFGSVDDMAAIMCERPDWAAWWPIRAAGWRHTRYQKD